MKRRQGTGDRAPGTDHPPDYRPPHERQGTGNRGSGTVPPRAPKIWLGRRVAMMGVGLLLATAATAGTVELTAEEAAARIVAVSDAAAAASGRLSAARAGVAAADSAGLPSLTAGAAVAQRSSIPEFRLPFAPGGQEGQVLVPDITTTYDASLRVAQALYSGGAITGARQAARQESAASAASRQQTLADLRFTARLAYWEAARARAALASRRAQEDRSTRLLHDTEALFRAGMAVRADVLAAKERVASARVAVIRATNAVANTEGRLVSLLHLGPEDHIELADSLTGGLPAAPAGPAALEQEALAKRPELAAASATIAALRAREELARAEARPTVGVAAQWDYARPNARYFPQVDAWKSSWSVGLQSTWTLFDGGKAHADLAASQATRSAAASDEQELERRIGLEVQTKRRDLESALATVAAADDAHAAAEERERAARERHAAGLATMSEILDAEAQLAAAEQQQVDARASSWMAEADLARAIGQ
jgi:outer membrane protein